MDFRFSADINPSGGLVDNDTIRFGSEAGCHHQLLLIAPAEILRLGIDVGNHDSELFDIFFGIFRYFRKKQKSQAKEDRICRS